MDQLANYIVDPAMNNRGVTIQPGLPATAAGYAYHNVTFGSGLYDIEVHLVPENDGSPRYQLYIGGNSNPLMDTVLAQDPSATDPATDRKGILVKNADVETKMTIKLKRGGDELISHFKDIPGTEKVTLTDDGFEFEWSAGTDIREDVAKYCVEKGLGLIEMKPQVMSIEDLYLKIVSGDVEQ